jgi:drug/metabolite transporter (DMT)-like permease
MNAAVSAMSPRDTSIYLLLAAIWGGNFVLMKFGAPEFGPVPLAALRAAFAALFLLPVTLVGKHLPTVVRHWRALAVFSILNNVVPFILIAYATRFVSAGLASILNATMPLWVCLVAWIWFSERLGMLRIVGMAVGMVGVATIAWADVSTRSKDGYIAVTACLGGALSLGLAANYVKKHFSQMHPIPLTFGSSLFAAMLLAIPAGMAWPNDNPSVVAWAVVLLQATVSSAMASVLYYLLVERIGQTKAASIAFLIPVFAATWDSVFFRHVPSANSLVGATIVLAGSAMVTGFINVRMMRNWLQNQLKG